MSIFMNYTKEERMAIGSQIYTHEITIGDDAEYMRQYGDLNNLPPMFDGKNALKVINKAQKKDFDALESLSRKELIDEIIKSLLKLN